MIATKTIQFPLNHYCNIKQLLYRFRVWMAWSKHLEMLLESRKAGTKITRLRYLVYSSIQCVSKNGNAILVNFCALVFVSQCVYIYIIYNKQDLDSVYWFRVQYWNNMHAVVSYSKCFHFTVNKLYVCTMSLSS